MLISLYVSKDLANRWTDKFIMGLGKVWNHLEEGDAILLGEIAPRKTTPNLFYAFLVKIKSRSSP